MDPRLLADWRIGLAGKVAKSNGRFQEGQVVMVMMLTETPGVGTVRMPIVGPARLALGAAIKAANAARRLIRTVRFLPADNGGVSSLDMQTAPALFDYFESCMVAISFSYKSLETYANDMISRRLRTRTITIVHRRKVVELGATELERRLSTSEKYALVLPMILDLSLSKSTRLWQRFRALEKARDAAVHLKSLELQGRGGTVDRESLFFTMLRDDPREYPRIAIAMMRHFIEVNTEPWLAFAEEQIAADLPQL
jgi:hypothetical protein